MTDKFITKHLYLFLAVISLVAISVRLYHITGPIADWHSWRQADTAAVARNFLRFGIDPLHPRYDDLSNIQSGKDNPKGYRMVEFPFYQTVGAWLEKSAPFVAIEVWLRILTISASIGTIIFLGLLVVNFIDPLTGILAATVYAVLPYSVYYGRAILPDPQMVFWSVLCLWLLSRKWTAGAGLAGALALLSKPMALFLLVPAVWILWKQYGISKKFFLEGALFTIISAGPILLWRRWILQYPEGIPASTWLLNGNGIRFKGAWFHWLFATRLGDLILGFWGLIPFGIGLIAIRAKKEGWFFQWWIIGALIYLVVFATGNVQHDYYQIPVIPVISIMVAKGLGVMLRQRQYIMAVICVTAMIGFSWYTIRTYYWINRPEIIEAGRMADQILPKDAKVIASYNGDTTFLYQTGRQGWPLGFEIDKKIAMGATAYVTVSPTDADGETKDLANRYTVLVRNDRYAIIDLTKPRLPSGAIKK